MNWFERMKSGFRTRKKKGLPDGVWIKCDGCEELLYQKELEKNLRVCPKCDYHFRTSSKEYLNILADEDSFQVINAEMTSVDPLNFKDVKRYTDRFKEYVKRTGENSAILTGVGKINGHSLALAVMDFSFIGGSMGSVVGEKVVRLINTAIENRLPLVIVSTSGGARMQESALSLMQMAKTSANLFRLSQQGLPYISVLVNPCTAGVLASFASLGDITIAEPKTLIRFSGPRVTKETTGEEMPPGFQPAEAVLEHGFLDMVVHRKDLKATLTNLIKLLT
ncbi:MAG: acetyl-CoA carboxylase carboxyltransferase subunit beta [Candidatus Latescibacteria bacterium]|nr:acetyl-CoA carboxylase carboxyltransferase subunit beta [Candidatus Latescibacterota bacterium]